jgi:hypothetical protein
MKPAAIDDILNWVDCDDYSTKKMVRAALERERYVVSVLALTSTVVWLGSTQRSPSRPCTTESEPIKPSCSGYPLLSDKMSPFGACRGWYWRVGSNTEKWSDPEVFLQRQRCKYFSR